MKRFILVLEVLLMALIPSVLFSLFAMIWLDTIFWLKIAGTLVLSYKIFDFILTLAEAYMDRKKISKVTDDIMTAFKSFKEDKPFYSSNTPPNGTSEEKLSWYEKEIEKSKKRFTEDCKEEQKRMGDIIRGNTNPSEEELFCEGARSFIIRSSEKNPTLTKRGRKKIDEHIEGMSPIARHKYEKELKAKAKRPSAKVKSTKK